MNRAAEDVQGLTAHRSLADIGEPVDLVVVAAAMGAGAVVTAIESDADDVLPLVGSVQWLGQVAVDQPATSDAVGAIGHHACCATHCPLLGRAKCGSS